MHETEAINLLASSKSLAQTLYRDNSYILTMTDLIKLNGVEQVLEAGYTRNEEVMKAAGLRRFDLALLLGALYCSRLRSEHTLPLLRPPAQSAYIALG